MGAGFCHVCGATRSSKSVASPSPRWTRHLEFHHIKERMGLPTASLVAFLIGVACALCALGVGLVFSVATILDWQAIQLYRVEWLLGSAAAFLAGILLKQAAKQG